jgi:DNA-binding transcriptional MerR regulator
METLPDRRYAIGDVSEITGVDTQQLRRWEEKFPQLKPKRDRAKRRYYTPADIDIVRRIKFLLRHDKMTIEGARIRLAQELHGEGRPRTRQETIDLLDKMENEIRAMLDILDSK